MPMTPEALSRYANSLANQYDEAGHSPAANIIRFAAASVSGPCQTPDELDGVYGILPVHQVEIHRELVGAFIERQGMTRKPNDKVVDAALAGIINGKFGARVHDCVPLTVVICPVISREDSPEVLEMRGLERGREAVAQLKGAYNRIIHNLENGQIRTVDALRRFDLSTTPLPPHVSMDSLQNMQIAYAKLPQAA